MKEFKSGDKVSLLNGPNGVIITEYEDGKYVVSTYKGDICCNYSDIEQIEYIDWQYVIDGGFDIVNIHSGGISRPFKHFNINNFTIRQEIGHVQPHFGGGKPDHINDMVNGLLNHWQNFVLEKANGQRI